MKHLDLFSGIGGFTLACGWAGVETIGFVEIDKYCQKVLRKHWPDVPIVEDIRDVKKIKEIVANSQLNGLSAATQRGGIGTTKNHSKEGTEARGKSSGGSKPNSKSHICTERTRTAISSSAILITAGFPCQPFSVAGKREGTKDDRYLWPQTIAVIKAIKPRWILLENVTGIINLALDTVLSDLEGAGYSYETLIIPACAVNAPHRRDRIWIVGHSASDGQPNTKTRRGIEPRNQRGKEGTKQVCQFEGTGSVWPKDVADTKRRQSRQQTESEGGQDTSRGSEEVATNSRLLRQAKRELQATGIAQCDWWAVEPKLGRVAHGIPPELDGDINGIKTSTQKAITEEQNLIWEGLREMWLSKEFTKTPSQLRGKRVHHSVPEMPYRNSLSGWHLGQRIQEDEELHNLWKRVCTTSFQEAQHLLPKLLEHIRQIQCDEAMESTFNSEPSIPRVATGVKNRVDRLKCLGNAIVPQVAYEIIKVIKEVEDASI